MGEIDKASRLITTVPTGRSEFVSCVGRQDTVGPLHSTDNYIDSPLIGIRENMGILDLLFGKKKNVVGLGNDLALIAVDVFKGSNEIILRKFFTENELPHNKLGLLLLEQFLYRLAIGFYWLDIAYRDEYITEQENYRINSEIRRAFQVLKEIPSYDQFLEEKTYSYRLSYHDDYRDFLENKPGIIPFRKTAVEMIKQVFSEDRIPSFLVQMSMCISSDAIPVTESIVGILKNRNIL